MVKRRKSAGLLRQEEQTLGRDSRDVTRRIKNGAKGDEQNCNRFTDNLGSDMSYIMSTPSKSAEPEQRNRRL